MNSLPGNLPGNYGLCLRAPSSEAALRSRIQADIVFIHGINGDPARTWVHEDQDGKVDWTADHGFLPSRFPLARIFTFKWNASVFHYSSDANIKHIASNLLSELEKWRTSHEEKYRKLIFVCHSLGGLVVQRALRLDASISPERKLLQDSTIGIIFLATPHGGSNLATVASKLLWLTDSPKSLVKLLSTGSIPLTKVTTKFTRYYYERRTDPSRALSIVSFGEKHRTPAGLFKVQVVPLDRAKLNVTGEIFEPVPKDHRSIARFKHHNDPVLNTIIHHLQKFINQQGPVVPPPPALSIQPRIHHIPMSVEQFCGQDNYLKQIYDLLSGPDTDKHLTVWGQRGIGKTELVLHYAIEHRHEYDTIKWFDASDEQTLRLQLETFYDFLSAEQNLSLQRLSARNRNNKCQTIIEWLHDQERCLIVYDNVDPASGFDLRRYFPQQCAAHRIVIGPNSSTCSLGNIDVEVCPMSLGDSVSMFLKLSGAGGDERSLEVLEVVQQIVEELDRTPFHLALAAQNFRASQPSFSAFLERLKKENQDPRIHEAQLVAGDGSTIWSMAFNRVKARESSLMLLNLFAMLDGFDIQSNVLERFGEAVRRWNPLGDEVLKTPEEDGVDGELIKLLGNDAAFESALQPLIDATFVRRHRSGRNKSRIEMRPLVQQFVLRMMSPEERLEWTKKLIRLISHAVPEDNCLEVRNPQALWPCLIPHVLKCHRVAKSYSAHSIGSLEEVHQPLVFLLLSSVGLSPEDDRGLLSLTDSLLRYRATIAQVCQAAKWRSYFLYFEDGRKNDAEKLLAKVQASQHAAVRNDPSLDTPQNNAALADVILHWAQCLFDQKNYSLARSVLKSWTHTSESKLELRFKRLIDTALCKILIFQEEYDDAMRGLEGVLAQADPVGCPIRDLDEYRWVTVILGQLCCKKREYARALEIVRPWMQRYLAEKRVGEFFTTDCRLIYCEALMYLGSGRRAELDAELETLDRDLQLPEQKGNPRAVSQLLATRRLKARAFYVRGRWAASANAWRIGTLGLLGIGENDLTAEDPLPGLPLSKKVVGATPSGAGGGGSGGGGGGSGNGDGSDVHAYEVAEAVISLALAYLRLGDYPRAVRYWDLAHCNPLYLEFPSAEIDYSEWLDFVRSEFDVARRLYKEDEGSRMWWRWPWGKEARERERRRRRSSSGEDGETPVISAGGGARSQMEDVGEYPTRPTGGSTRTPRLHSRESKEETVETTA